MQNFDTIGTIYKENLIKDIRGISTQDGSIGAAIGAFDYGDVNATVELSYNEIVDNTYGFQFISGTGNQLGEYTLIGNVLTNVDIGFETTALVTPVNAINNWWGDASGPLHPTLNPSGLGSSIAASDSVDFQPWALSPKID